MTNSSGADVRNYRTVLGHFCTGVTVVTSIDRGGPAGFTCQSFSALSLDPPLVLVCVRKESATWPGIRRSGRFAVSVLAADQRSIGDRFARSGIDRFAGTEWRPSPAGLPLISGALAWIECSVTDEIDAGDHTVVVAAVTGLETGTAGAPLLFHRGRYLEFDMREAAIG
ncbi:flavin reductase family protein [Streptomyces sp. DT24]|uniref:flavin reductase family protein n=1 Tax=unclassified Streptomyces TaxID=2593676 RepID=UPI0023B8E35C|nr:flavin reductase family protein [Streptomyces sp. AM 4-1-1]WEH36032.1 flavin reductase family protein [Streptomyces sp. AM 4-1-1]